MPSLTNDSSRHVVIDRRDGHYICFPDVLRADDGRLIVVYNEQDKHVEPTRRVLLLRTSDDNGRTWNDIVRMDSVKSHCPRLTKLEDGTIVLSDSALVFFTSVDNGLTWTTTPISGPAHDMIDKVIDLGNDTFLTTGHTHRGSFNHPAIRQAPTEQMVYRSEDGCKSWAPYSILANHRNLVLCEASMLQLPDGRIGALMRENSFVYEPMYFCFSDDQGGTWSDPIPTSLIGHRPTMGMLPDGRILVTYRNVAPDSGNCAWLGTLEELLSDFKVHGLAVDPTNPSMTQQGLRIQNGEGESSVVRYVLRPMSDPRSARATLEAEVKVDSADVGGCALRLGVWWRLFPDRIIPDIEDAQPIVIDAGVFNTIRLDYSAGTVTLSVNGEKRAAVEVDDDHADTRPILFGAPYPFENNSVDATWKRVSLDIDEPAFLRTYSWQWNGEDGLPDQWAQDNVLELKNARNTATPDFGYTGWTQLEDGSFFCTYHWADPTDTGYDPLHTSHIQGTWFSEEDFGK